MPQNQQFYCNLFKKKSGGKMIMKETLPVRGFPLPRGAETRNQFCHVIFQSSRANLHPP
jgi:hypothetical protein